MSSNDDSEEDSEVVLPVIQETPKQVAKTSKRGRVWIQPTNTDRQPGEYHRLCEELESNLERYFTYFRMSKNSFEELHDILRVHIKKLNTNWRRSISSRERLAICLRYLADGISFKSLAKSFHVARTTVSNIVNEVCKAIWDQLQPNYMPEPTEETWKESEIGYCDKWNFPNCVGSIDGKHIKLDCPGNNNSIVLLAISDPFNKFLFIELCEVQDTKSEVHILKNLQYYQEYIVKRPLLPPKPLPDSEDPMPHVLVGDEGFVLKPHIMRPFPKVTVQNNDRKRKFNERLSHARRPIQNSFEIMVEKWRVLQRCMECHVETAINVVKAACCLHNYLCAKHNDLNFTSETTALNKKPLKKIFIPIKRKNERGSNVAIAVREQFANYFNDS